MGKAIVHANNSEFLGDLSKFKYLAIHGYERWQVDKDGKLRDGQSSEWIKDYCRKDSDADYMNLTIVQRYTLDAMRRLTGLHGKWCPNDLMWVSRATCAAPKERMYVTHAVLVLVLRGLVTLSNVQLGSLEVRDQSREDQPYSTEAGSAPVQHSDRPITDSDSEAKAAPKAKPSVPKIQGKISVKPAPVPERPVPDSVKQGVSEYLANSWGYYELPGEAASPLWLQLIEGYGHDAVQVLRWAMFMNKDRYWLDARIDSVADFARFFPKMHEQYLKCGGPDLEKALEFADNKYCNEHQDVVLRIGDESLRSSPPPTFPRVCLEKGCTSRLVVEPGQTVCRQCRGVESESRLCSECALDYPDEGQELCLQCRLATVEVSDTDGLE